MQEMASAGDDAFDLDLAAASLRSDSADVGMLLKALVEQIGDALGPHLVVERRKSLLRKADAIRSLRITLGDDELRAEVEGASVTCTIGHSSGGIRIRSTRVGMDDWLKHLLRGLEREAAHSEAARTALEHIVIGGGP